MPGRNGEELIDARAVTCRILLPQQVVQEHAHRRHPEALGQPELLLDGGRVERVCLPHLELVDGGRRDVVAADEPGLFRVPGVGCVLRPAGRLTGLRDRGDAAEQQTERGSASVSCLVTYPARRRKSIRGGFVPPKMRLAAGYDGVRVGLSGADSAGAERVDPHRVGRLRVGAQDEDLLAHQAGARRLRVEVADGRKAIGPGHCVRGDDRHRPRGRTRSGQPRHACSPDQRAA